MEEKYKRSILHEHSLGFWFPLWGNALDKAHVSFPVTPEEE